jgi:hypothetical protein
MKVIESGVRLTPELEKAADVVRGLIKMVRDDFAPDIAKAVERGDARRVQELERACQMAQKPYVDQLVKIMNLGTPFAVVETPQ